MRYIFGNDRKLENRIFNICCLSIFVLACNNLGFGLFLRLGWTTSVINVTIMTFILFMFYFSNRGIYDKRYAKQTSIVLNFMLFPLLYFITNRIESGIYFYFLLGIVLSAATVSKESRTLVVASEIFLQTVIFTLRHLMIPNDAIIAEDCFYFAIINGFIITSISFGTIVITILKVYESKTMELQHFNKYLRELSEIDPLTGLWNRKYMEKTLNQYFNSVKEEGKKLSVVMFDIDHFKKVNDTHGHQVGDQVLKSFGKLVRKNIDASDVAVRYGGEEFLIIMPNKTEKSAYKTAEKIRKIVAKELEIPTSKKCVTVSGGVATYKSGMEVDDIVKKADSNLYLAKNSGRNKIVISDEKA